jgi:FHS family L-fucose permease-like MFS transporter
MEHVSPAKLAPGAQAEQANNTFPLIVITLLFFMWGLLTSLNDVLIPHLKAVYTLTYVQAMLVQFCFFGAYAIVSLPAGMLIKRIGYKAGAVTGLMIAAAGCALFYPAATSGYAVFLLAFFILAAGITVLQVAANPFVTVLGPPATASSRLTLTQAFNSLGTTIAPWLGGMLILSGVALGATELAAMSPAELDAYRAKEAAMVQGPYLGLAATLVLLAVLFAVVKLPAISHGDEPADSISASVLSHRHLLLAPSASSCTWAARSRSAAS